MAGGNRICRESDVADRPPDRVASSVAALATPLPFRSVGSARISGNASGAGRRESRHVAARIVKGWLR